MIKIISWNIRQGGGTRIPKIITRIQKTEAQIVTLNEFRNNRSGERIRAELLSLGYRFQIVSHSPSDKNSAMIASKLPCDGVLFPKCDPEYSGNIVCASFDAFDLYSVYLPHKKKHVLFDFFLKHLPPQKPSIIAGDFNSGINGVDQ